jgi:hypothetical protein
MPRLYRPVGVCRDAACRVSVRDLSHGWETRGKKGAPLPTISRGIHGTIGRDRYTRIMPIDLQLETEGGVATREINFLAASQGSVQPVEKSSRTDLTGWLILMSLVMVGCAIRIAAIFQHNPLELQITDPARWWHDATNLFTIEPILAIDAFGYQLWLGAVIWITGGGATAISVHNAALSILTPWIWHRMVKELTGDDDIALLAWAVFSWLPSWIAIFSYTMSETLFLPLFGVALWLSLRSCRLQSVSLYSSSALMWALAAATRVFALPFAAVMLLWNLWRSPRRIARISLATLAFALVAIPLSIREHHMLRVWNPFGFPRMNQIYMESGKQTLRFKISRDHHAVGWSYEFGSPSLYQEPLEPASHWKPSREGVTDFAIDEDRGMADWDAALRKYRAPWRQRLHLWAENSIIFNFAPSWPDNNPDRFWDRVAIVLRWAWLPLALLTLAWNIVAFRRMTGTARMFAILTSIAWTLTPLLPAVMEGRYRKPVEGLLIVNLLLLVKLWKTKSEERSRKAIFRGNL